jgi:hypothetical protein
MPGLGQLTGWCAIILSVPAFAGLLFTVVYISFLADWANDLSLGMRLRVTPFSLLAIIPVGALTGGVASLVRSSPRMIVVAPLMLIVGGAFLVCIGFFVVPIIQFAVLCHWARKNVDEGLDRDRRASSNIVKRIEEGKAKHEPAPQAFRNREKRRPQGNYLAPRDDGEAIALAPEEPAKPQ